MSMLSEVINSQGTVQSRLNTMRLLLASGISDAEYDGGFWIQDIIVDEGFVDYLGTLYFGAVLRLGAEPPYE
jgi:hypothetical protein